MITFLVPGGIGGYEDISSQLMQHGGFDRQSLCARLLLSKNLHSRSGKDNKNSSTHD